MRCFKRILVNLALTESVLSLQEAVKPSVDLCWRRLATSLAETITPHVVTGCGVSADLTFWFEIIQGPHRIVLVADKCRRRHIRHDRQRRVHGRPQTCLSCIYYRLGREVFRNWRRWIVRKSRDVAEHHMNLPVVVLLTDFNFSPVAHYSGVENVLLLPLSLYLQFWWFCLRWMTAAHAYIFTCFTNFVFFERILLRV